MAYKLFIDTNVYLDFLMQRGSGRECAKDIFKLAEEGAVEVFTSASSVLNLLYVMGTYKLPRSEIIENTYSILSFTKLINPGNISFEIALSSAFKDMEDAVQYYTAIEIKGIDYFITSDIKDYKSALSILTVTTPAAFMKVYDMKS